MIIIAGRLDLDPAERGAYLAATFDVAVQARRAPGCLDFVQAPDPVEPGRVNVYERWETDGDVEAFRSSGDPAGVAAPVPEIRSADVQKYRISAVEAP